MQDITISTAGVNKLLSGLNVSKAAGPGAIRPIVLKELCQVIAPVVALIFQTSFDSGIPTEWKKAQVCPFLREAIKQTLQITSLSHSPAYSVDLWST